MSVCDGLVGEFEGWFERLEEELAAEEFGVKRGSVYYQVRN